MGIGNTRKSSMFTSKKRALWSWGAESTQGHDNSKRKQTSSRQPTSRVTPACLDLSLCDFLHAHDCPRQNRTVYFKTWAGHWLSHPSHWLVHFRSYLLLREQLGSWSPPIFCSPVSGSWQPMLQGKEKNLHLPWRASCRCILAPLPTPEGYRYFLPCWMVWRLSALIIIEIRKFAGGKSPILTEQGYLKWFFFFFFY